MGTKSEEMLAKEKMTAETGVRGVIQKQLEVARLVGRKR